MTLAGPQLLDPTYLLDHFGLIGLMVIIFAECGLLIGFFLPGDTLLFTVGLLISNDILHVSLWAALVAAPVAAVLGNLAGYWIGWRAGPAVFERPDSRLFKREHVDKARVFFDRYGAIAVLLARFVPVVRTFVTVMAGASRMRFATYAVYSFVGGVVWSCGVTVAGYYLGKIGVIRDNVDLILAAGAVGAALLVATPVLIRLWRRRGPGGGERGERAAKDATPQTRDGATR